MLNLPQFDGHFEKEYTMNLKGVSNKKGNPKGANMKPPRGFYLLGAHKPFLSQSLIKNCFYPSIYKT
jgi:hypothetical protein